MKKTKKLKLYGKKNNDWHFIATVYVKNNEVVVEAEDSQVKDDLLKEIKKADMLGFIVLKRDVKTEHGWELQEKPQKPGDPEFLEALQDSSIFRGKEYGGYKTYGPLSKIVEE